MKKLTVIILFLCLSTFISSCRTINNEGVGMLAGGVAGGLLGSTVGGGSGRAIAIAGGTFLGAVIGGKIGAYMDRQDREEVYNTLESYPDGRAREWHNPNTNRDYVVTPTKTYEREYNNSTQPCREYTTTAIINGKQEKIYGTACRMADGSWKIQNA